MGEFRYEGHRISYDSYGRASECWCSSTDCR